MAAKPRFERPVRLVLVMSGMFLSMV